MASENGKNINVTGNNGTNGTVGKNGTLRLNSSNPPKPKPLNLNPQAPNLNSNPTLNPYIKN